VSPDPVRVGVIGPVLPFRGGIAQHTTQLLRALAAKADVLAISFTRQYPKLIFPGESDRDPAFEGQVEGHTEYLIDSVNPFTWSTAVRRMKAFRPDMVVLPWWQVYWAPSFAHMAWRLRRAGIPVVFLCHNVTEHEAAAWKRAVTRWVLSFGSGYVVQTNLDREHLLELIPTAKPVLHLHPAYDQFPPATGRLAPEHALELLFFGFVRPYKGLDLLIEAMGLLPRDMDVRLTVAGEFWHGPEETRARIEELGIADKVEIVAGYLSEQDVAEYFGRAHALVLPYRSATGSGVVAIAHHYEKPVIVTRVGGLPDVVEDGVTGFVVEPDSPAAIADAIVSLADRDMSGMAEAVRRFKAEKLTWEGLADAVLEAGGLS
jgi:glycosyltransferase involved in cell wall biosynthesis